MEKIGSAWFNYKKKRVISTIHKLFEYNVCWNCLKFSDKMDLSILMRTSNNSKRCHCNLETYF